MGSPVRKEVVASADPRTASESAHSSSNLLAEAGVLEATTSFLSPSRCVAFQSNRARQPPSVWNQDPTPP